MDEVNYIISDEIKVMAAIAGPLALRVNQRMAGSPDCASVGSYPVYDHVKYVGEKLSDLELTAPEVMHGVNRLAECTSEVQVEMAMEDLEAALERVLADIDEVKCVEFPNAEDVKSLLLAVMKRPVQDTTLMLQKLSQAVNSPERFAVENGEEAHIDLTVTYEVDAELSALMSRLRSEHRIKEKCFGLGTVLAAFGAGWLVGDD